ncbi:hypothetical protein EPN42_09245 [bacterium]|nr:MAG: hypothetical protein EPN42_09245 [bacterium]
MAKERWWLRGAGAALTVVAVAAVVAVNASLASLLFVAFGIHPDHAMIVSVLRLGALATGVVAVLAGGVVIARDVPSAIEEIEETRRMRGRE